MGTYEVVISGVSGEFPGCDTVEELVEALQKEVSLIQDEGRWSANATVGGCKIPHQVGKINDPYKLDAAFFGILNRTGEFMNPNTKIILQNSIGAVIDSGYSLNEIRGSNIATIVGISIVETEYEMMVTNKRPDITIVTQSAAMQANRIAHAIDLKGPSFVCDEGWNGTLEALRMARNLISSGKITAAIVAGANLLFLPAVSYHFERLGRLNKDGKTKCFSDDADGYSRSEACVVFFLQRKEDARRVYGTLLGVDVTINGYKEGALIDCSSFDSKFIKSLYEKCNVDPSSVSYLEASGIASKAVDANELNVASEVFLQNRTEPLLVGCIKSNLGNTEVVSGAMGILKAIISSELEVIPPNLHYSGPNKLVPALLSGDIQVVAEPKPLKGDILAINNLNITGGLGHVILKRNPKTKKQKCEVGILPPDKIPRLVMVSGRDQEALQKVLEKIEKMPIDEEYVTLVNRVFSKGMKKYFYRGYTVLHDINTKQCFREIKEHALLDKRPLWFVFAGMGSQWPSMATDLMIFPAFANSIMKCHKFLEPYGVNLLDIVNNPHPDVFKEIFNCFVGIAAVQIGLIDLIKHIGLEHDGMVGHSLGELGCGYMDGTFTTEQAIMNAYYRGKVSAEYGMKGGMMAAVGLGYASLKQMVPDGIDIACRNSSTSCTISGPASLVNKFLEELNEKNIFVRAVPSGGIPYHSRYIQHLGPKFLESLRKLVPDPKPRSKKWISTSVPESKWNTVAASLNSAEYHVNNMLSPVLFEDALKHIPENAILLEISPRGLLQAILKREFSNATCISLTTRDENSHLHLLSSLGKLYNEGLFVDIEKLYPPIEFPVSRGTPSLQNLVTWNNLVSWSDYEFTQLSSENRTEIDLHFNDSKQSNYNVFCGYKMNDIAIVPSSAYIEAVINNFVMLHPESQNRAVLLSNVCFKKILKYGETNPVKLTIRAGTGCWECSIIDDYVAFGQIQLLPPQVQRTKKSSSSISVGLTLSSEEIYLYLNEMGLSVDDKLKLIDSVSINEDGTFAIAYIEWKDDWLTFMSSLFMFITFANSFYKCKLHFLKQITEMFIDFSFFCSQRKVVHVYYDAVVGLWADGLKIINPVIKEAILETPEITKIEFHSPRFISFERSEIKTEEYFQFVELCTKVVLQNIPQANRRIQLYSVCNNLSKQKEIYAFYKKHFCSEHINFTPLPNDGDLNFKRNIDLENFNLMIINEDISLNNSLKILSRSKNGFLICKNPESLSSLTCVLSRKLGNDVYYLCKTVQNISKESVPHLITSSSWIEELQMKLSEGDTRIIYLAGYYSSLNYINEVVQQCLSLINSDSLRFVFMESKCDLFKPEAFKEQLSKDIKINVMKNGKWGTVLFNPIGLLSQSQPLEADQSNVYQFRDIMRVNDVNLKALGLNLASIDTDKKKLGVFDYSGEKNGKAICGLATLNEETTKLEFHDEFVWDKPDNWSHEDISAVLVFYALAYNMLHVELNYKRQLNIVNRILVFNGELPLSQAVISIAINMGFEVFTTYDDVYSRKQEITELFPDIPDGNILKSGPKLENIIAVKTKGEGVGVLVYTSDNVDFLKSASNMISTNGKFYQVSCKSRDPVHHVGLRVFLNSICWHGIGPEILFNLPDVDKQELWKLVDIGLRNGEIKPIKKCVHSTSTSNVDILLQMNDEYVLNKKIIVSTKVKLRVDSNETKFLCNADKSYIILGRENPFWFYLFKWLMKHGGRKFVIFVDNISSNLNKRLSYLLCQNKSIKITLYSTKVIETRGMAHIFFNQLKVNTKIGAMFIFGKEFHFIKQALGSNNQIGLPIVLFGENVDNGLNGNSERNRALTFETPQKEKNMIMILQNLDSLLQFSDTICLKEFPIDVQISDMELSHFNYYQHLPHTLPDIANLARTSGKARWKELRTKGPRHSNSREIPPVFILPPLRKGQMDKMIGRIFASSYTAILPSEIKSLQGIAEDLAQEIEKFKWNIFTIICTDWSFNLGLAIGKELEKHGKIVSLIILYPNMSWDNLNIVKSIHLKAKMACLDSSQKSSKDISMLDEGIHILRNRLEVVSNSSLSCQPNFKGLCHVLITKNSNDNWQSIQEHCEMPIKVHTLQFDDFVEMIGSSEAAQIVNRMTLVEHKDSAYPIPKQYETFISGLNVKYADEVF